MFNVGPDHGQIANDIIQNHRMQKDIDDMEQELAQKDNKIKNLEHERDIWCSRKETVEAVLAARTKQLYTTLGVLHTSNPYYLSDPQKDFQSRLDADGQQAYTQYLDSNFKNTEQGYEIRPHCFTPHETNRGRFSGTLLEDQVYDLTAKIEESNPDYFERLYNIWKKPENETKEEEIELS